MSSAVTNSSVFKIVRSIAVKHPLRTFLVVSLAMSWVVLTPLALNSLPFEPGLLILVYIGLLGTSLLITYWKNGKKGVKELLSGLRKWRVNIGYYLIAFLAIPILTIILASFTGSLDVPEKGWGSVVMTYLISLITGVIIINFWEELAWTGFLQKKLMDEKGLLKGSLLTAPAFTAIHLPLIVFQSDVSQIPFNIFATLVLSLFFRYLIGMLFYDTGGSLLIVGLLHASNNSSNSWDIVEGEYELITAIIFLTIIIVGYRKLSGKSVTSGKLSSKTYR